MNIGRKIAYKIIDITLGDRGCAKVMSFIVPLAEREQKRKRAKALRMLAEVESFEATLAEVYQEFPNLTKMPS